MKQWRDELSDDKDTDETEQSHLEICEPLDHRSSSNTSTGRTLNDKSQISLKPSVSSTSVFSI